MKIKKFPAIYFIVFFDVMIACGQSTFQDLDFEAANLSNQSGPFHDVPISEALPGWSGMIGDVPVTQVWANTVSTGLASIDVFGPGYQSIGQGNPFGQGIIDGNYTVFIQSGGGLQNEAVGVNVSLFQVGTIPANAQSLQFKAWNYVSSTAVSISFDGNSLSPVLLSSTPTAPGIPVNEYAVNIAPYAGETGQLEFTSVFPTQGPLTWFELDDITFSTMTATPEPDTLALVVLGGVAFGVRHWRRKSS